MAKSAFVPEVLRMYSGAMKLSPRFAAGFRSFWKLGRGFEFTTEN